MREKTKDPHRDDGAYWDDSRERKIYNRQSDNVGARTTPVSAKSNDRHRDIVGAGTAPLSDKSNSRHHDYVL